MVSGLERLGLQSEPINPQMELALMYTVFRSSGVLPAARSLASLIPGATVQFNRGVVDSTGFATSPEAVIVGRAHIDKDATTKARRGQPDASISVNLQSRAHIYIEGGGVVTELFTEKFNDKYNNDGDYEREENTQLVDYCKETLSSRAPRALRGEIFECVEAFGLIPSEDLSEVREKFMASTFLD